MKVEDYQIQQCDRNVMIPYHFNQLSSQTGVHFLGTRQEINTMLHDRKSTKVQNLQMQGIT